MNKWSTKLLGDVAQAFNGKTPSRSEQRSEGYPVLKIKNVSEYGQFYGSFDSFVDRSFADKFDPKKIKPGDILILNAAHNADYVGSKIYLAESHTYGALATGEWLLIRASENLFANYAYHWISSLPVRHQIRDLVKGIHLYPKDLAKLQIPLPSLPEQRQIAAILDQADALRAKRRESLAELDKLAQSIFIEMFGDPFRNEKSWDVTSFENSLTDETSLSPKLLQSGYLLKGTYPVIDQGQDFIAGYYNNKDLLCKSSLPVIIFGDHTRIIKLVRIPFVVGADGAKVLKTKEYFDPIFMAVLLKLYPIPNLGYSRHMKEIKRIIFIAPPIELQLKFRLKFEYLEELKNINKNFFNESGTLFSSLQHLAFRGEL